MGFQFNHVGGGTKARRPIALHMKDNSAWVQPNCLYVNDTAHDQEMTLGELQEYIKAENQRQSAEDQFWGKEIDHSPNLTIWAHQVPGSHCMWQQLESRPWSGPT